MAFLNLLSSFGLYSLVSLLLIGNDEQALAMPHSRPNASDASLTLLELRKRARLSDIRARMESLLSLPSSSMPSSKLIDSELISDAWQSSLATVTMPSATASPELIPFADYTEKLRSIAPSCSVPPRAKRFQRRVGLDASKSLLLFFPLRHHSAKQGFRSSIFSSKLKLFIKNTTSSPGLEEPLWVSVSWIKKEKYEAPEKRLLSTERVTSAGWLELDVLEATRYLTRRPSRNFGLVVTVAKENNSDVNNGKEEDNEEKEENDNITNIVIPARDYVQDVDCDSDWAATRVTLPSFLTSKENLRPMLDISTYQVPLDEMPNNHGDSHPLNSTMAKTVLDENNNDTDNVVNAMNVANVVNDFDSNDIGQSSGLSVLLQRARKFQMNNENNETNENNDDEEPELSSSSFLSDFPVFHDMLQHTSSSPPFVVLSRDELISSVEHAMRRQESELRDELRMLRHLANN